jgi:hypothetical protein
MAATPYQHRYAQPIWPADFANQPDDCLLLILRQVMLRNKLMRVNPGITQNRYFDRPRSRIGPRFTSRRTLAVPGPQGCAPHRRLSRRQPGECKTQYKQQPVQH